MSRLLVALGIALGVLGGPHAASASTVSLSFAGTVDFISPTELASMGLSANLGDVLAGSFVYDPGTASADGFPQANQGVYGLDISSSSLSWAMGTSSWASDGTTLRGTYGALSPNPSFAVVVVTGAGEQLAVAASSTLGGVEYQTTLNFYGYQAANDSIPTAIGPFTRATLTTYRIFEFTPGNWVGTRVFAASVTPTSTAPVPEPSTAALLGGGIVLGGCVLMSHRSRAKRPR